MTLHPIDRLPHGAPDAPHEAWTLVSIVVPACDEAENLPAFLAQCAAMREDATIAAPHVRYEAVVVNDGSRDSTPEILLAAKARYPWLVVCHHRARRGIAEALRTGGAAAQGVIHVFYPADLQFAPADIPRLVSPILANDADLVTGAKQGVYEKAFVSRIYNSLARRLFRVAVRDMNSVKAYRREVVQHMTLRPDFHRYLVVMAAAAGFRLAEVPITLHPRHAGHSKFTWRRIPVGVVDLCAVWFEWRFGQKPLMIFGALGACCIGLSVAMGLLGVSGLVLAGVGARWFWTLTQTAFLTGVVAIVAGLLSEQIAQQRAEVRQMAERLDARSDVPRA